MHVTERRLVRRHDHVDDAVVRPRGQPERLVPVAEVRPHRPLRAGRRARPVSGPEQRDGGCASSCWTPGRPRVHTRSAALSEEPVGDRLGRRDGSSPTRPERVVDEPLPGGPRSSRAALGGVRRHASRGPAIAWRRTRTIRWTTVIVLATASAQSTIVSRIGSVEDVGQPGHHEHGDQPVGALGDATLGRHAEALGLGSRVRRHRAHHQAPQGDVRRAGRRHRPGTARSPGRRRSRRRRAGRASSRGTTPHFDETPSVRAM